MSVDLKGLKDKFKDAQDIKESVMPDAHRYFKDLTPIRSGNAKRNTRLNNNKEIEANYKYAGQLDQGSSKQAPKGMSEPTIAHLKRLVVAYIKKIGA